MTFEEFDKLFAEVTKDFIDREAFELWMSDTDTFAMLYEEMKDADADDIKNAFVLQFNFWRTQKRF